MNPDTHVATPSFTLDSRNSVAPQPPVAQHQPVETVIHGDRLIDNYAWLRDKNNPEVIAYLNAENAYTDTVLRDTEPFQEKLYQEMLDRILQTDLSVPTDCAGISISHAPKRASSTRSTPASATRKTLPKNCSWT